MTLMIGYAQRLDDLLAAMARTINDAGLGPFDEETVLLPAYGMQRWVDQELSHHLQIPGRGAPANISAGIDYRVPRGLGEVFGLTKSADWHPRELVWRILDVLDTDPDADSWAPAGLVPSAEDPGSNRYGPASKVARLFAAYSTERPRMLREWLERRENDGRDDLPPEQRWQPRLFTRLVRSIGQPPAELLTDEVERRAKRSGITRLHLFGYTRLSAGDLEILARIESHMEVHLWLITPSPSQFREHFDRGVTGEQIHRKDLDRPSTANGLLDGLGGQSRELAICLNRTFPSITPVEATGTGSESGTLLASVKEALAEARKVSSVTKGNSVQVHSCHGPTRQVEVLREALTDLFQTHKDLQPRDVLILCPDIETYAPLFQAAFNIDSSHPGARIPIVVADRNYAATNPLFDLALDVVGLVGGRVTSTSVIDLLQRDVVKRRFDLEDSDVETITAWVRNSGIRWGFDLRDRERFGLPTAQSTIEFGLDRLLLGVALGDEDPVGGVLPVPEVTSTEVELLGDFAEFISRLRSGIHHLNSAKVLSEWVEGVRTLVNRISKGEAWQESQLEKALAPLGRYDQTSVSKGDILTLLEELTAPSGGSATLRTGAMTAGALIAQRPIPHKVVCLVGMDEGSLPRLPPRDGDDILLLAPLVGEYDLRYEDQQTFLDTIASAAHSVIFTYSGAGHERGEERLPAAPLETLLEALPVPRKQTVTTHPLHPFDPRYFGEEGFVSYDLRAAEAARLQEARVTPSVLITDPVAQQRLQAVSLSQLQSFFADPVKAFIQQTLGVALPSQGDDLPEELPIVLNDLDKWVIGERLLSSSEDNNWGLANTERENCRGDVAPGELGRGQVREIDGVITKIANEITSIVTGEARSLAIDVKVSDLSVTGTVPRVYGNTIVHRTYRTLGSHHSFPAWIELLATVIHYPNEMWNAVVVGRQGADAVKKTLVAPRVDEAQEILADLLELYEWGLKTPLLIPPKTSAEWAKQLRGFEGASPPEAYEKANREAAKRWEGTNRPGENIDRYQKLAWGGTLSFEQLLEFPPYEQEEYGGETTRFGALAMRMWKRMGDHEQ